MNDMIFVTDIKHGTHKYITAIERGNPNNPVSARSVAFLRTWVTSLNVSEELRFDPRPPKQSTHVLMYGDGILDVYSYRLMPS